jgi:RNA polymerase sigma-70 factor (ECF subfamily)
MKFIVIPCNLLILHRFTVLNELIQKLQSLDTLSDNALMLKVKNGDIDKMGLLYERHHRLLFRFIFNMTRQIELSEDMVQNIFLRMLKYPEGFMGFGEFKMWMYHIARNVVYDHFRKVKRTPAHSDVKDYEEKIEGEQITDARLEKDEELKMLESAMTKLSDENRELLILCRYQELKYNEIAKILNTTEGAIKVRVYRALNQLKSNYLKIEK